MRNKLKDILLIEDDDKDAELILLSLKRSSLANDIKRLEDGQKAIDFFNKIADLGEQDKFPLFVLLDLKLPKVSGHEILDHIRANEVTNRIPVIILTSSKEEGDLVKSYELKANAYVVKPLKLDEFMQAVNEIGVFWAIHNEPPPK